MPKHFEELWEEAEKLHQEINDEASSASLLDELIAKLSIYKVIDQNVKITAEEKAKLKSNTFGKILASLTNLSLKDNVNTYLSLQSAIDDLKIEALESKYS